MFRKATNATDQNKNVTSDNFWEREPKMSFLGNNDAKNESFSTILSILLTFQH